MFSYSVSKLLVAHSAQLHNVEILQKRARCSMAQLQNLDQFFRSLHGVQ